MKLSIKVLFISVSILMTFSCQEKIKINNHFSSLSDTLLIKTKKIKGNGLFDLGYGVANFKDTTEKFSNSIKYPNNIKNIKRYQLKVDLREEKNNNIEIILGKKADNQVFIIDQNNNKDLTDDLIRVCESMNWSSPPELVKCKYLISNGKELVKDSSWLRIGSYNGNVLLGKREYLIGQFNIDNNYYEIGIVEPRFTMSFNYSVQPELAVLSIDGLKIDSLAYSDLIKFGEVVKLKNNYYRFENISNNGDLLTLVKEVSFETKIGTQKGMIAPEFLAVTVSGDTINNSIFESKLTVIANSCGCGGDKKSTEAFYEIEKKFGSKINLIHVDSNFEKSNTGVHIDSEVEFNRSFYNNYRQQFCSRICYVIGRNKRIIDKFQINEWKAYLPNIIEKKN